MTPEEQLAWQNLVAYARARGWLKFEHDGVLVIIRPPETPPPVV